MDIIDVEEFLYEFKVKADQMELFGRYLQEVFNILLKQANDKNTKEIDCNAFFNYYDLPVLISKRLFNVFDIDNNGLLNKNEFFTGMLNLFCSNFSIMAKMVFNLYDYDKDGLISKEDIKIVFSYMPIAAEGQSIVPKHYKSSNIIKDKDDNLKTHKKSFSISDTILEKKVDNKTAAEKVPSNLIAQYSVY